MSVYRVVLEHEIYVKADDEIEAKSIAQTNVDREQPTNESVTQIKDREEMSDEWDGAILYGADSTDPF